MAAEIDDFPNINLVNKKSIAELNQPQTEKPLHYTYLKEFRVEQCQLFLQHKCTQHRPFSCFCWHFLNQKRRRPKKKPKDGTFTYSPDVYCQQYNETTGECLNGDDCPYLHRVAGDVERRYHLRYYKTSPCVYETDTRGYCVKNGPHCAFAHGPHDLRQPVYDVRELQIMEQEEKDGDSSKQIVPEDPRWNDTNYVLSTYKTEPCKKPPRLCRQGYACPQYHNNRDRRRSPRKYKYRSTPCPNVKHADEWGDPSACENGDSCAYCHTRTEQQFHPEIYKSTKCNDMQQTAQCPRGPFCAFAHIEQDQINAMEAAKGSISIIPDKELMQQNQQNVFNQTSPLPSPAGMPNPRPKRSSSLSGPYAKIVEGSISRDMQNLALSSSAPAYEKAPGSGRRCNSRGSDHGQSFFGPSMSQGSQGSEPRTPSNQMMSAAAQSFYPETDVMAQSSALDNELLSAISNIDNTFEFDFHDTASIGSASLPGSTTGAGLPANSFLEQFSNNSSHPVSIPGTDMRHSSFTSQQSNSPTSPSMAPNNSFYGNQSASRASYVRSPKSGSFGLYDMLQSPKFNSPSLTSPLANSLSGGANTDVHRLVDEVMSLRSKLASWEESWTQAKQACEAWKREVAEQSDKAQAADREKMQVLIKLGEVEAEVRQLRQELETSNGGGPSVHLLKPVADLETMPIVDLKQVFNQLKLDVEKLEKVLTRRDSMKCVICEETPRCVVTYPCTHCVMCSQCSHTTQDCPHCHKPISQKTSITIP